MLGGMPKRAIFPIERPDGKNQNHDSNSHASNKRTAEVNHAVVQCPLFDQGRTTHHIRPTTVPIAHHIIFNIGPDAVAWLATITFRQPDIF